MSSDGLVVFLAPCPDCGEIAWWRQAHGDGAVVQPENFQVECVCDAA